MKLKTYQASLEEKLSEFDTWVTPSLGEIRDTQQFKINLDGLKAGFDLLEKVTSDFADYRLCSAQNLAENTIRFIHDMDDETAKPVLDSICNVLLLATGKTDNNLKCQYPLVLRNTYSLFTYPVKNTSGKWREKELPRTISFGDVTKMIIQLREKAKIQNILAVSYFHLVVSDEQYAKQLWSLGNAYSTQKSKGYEDSLLSSIVIFQSRGSITATQGHIPEAILRSYMNDWGLESGIDYNEQDVEIGQLIEGIPANNQIKKRKYDFVIPYQSRRDGAKIFVQSQFYAGDSGSVSHKVVDQTDSTREVTLQKYPKAVFVEYLDGAGYFSSLNGDLRKMLAKGTTKDFFQIRTAPIKLRRELQCIHFLTTLEIEHAVLRTDGMRNSVIKTLQADGYDNDEITLALNNALENKQIHIDSDNRFLIIGGRVEIVRKYCLLDLLANYGKPIPDGEMTGCLTVAGYENVWGMPQAALIETALKYVPNIDGLWADKLSPFADIQWLLEKGLIKSR